MLNWAGGRLYDDMAVVVVLFSLVATLPSMPTYKLRELRAGAGTRQLRACAHAHGTCVYAFASACRFRGGGKKAFLSPLATTCPTFRRWAGPQVPVFGGMVTVCWRLTISVYFMYRSVGISLKRTHYRLLSTVAVCRV